ncbi:hypothetical protein [Antribacter gilvus]|uniref:hypothetical protein n=1 Tax=Antribacter gilvus TaxID=2304675 RepID=UPI000F77098A|nr:hypothetical protein [Antribacter gilvus]
MTGKAIARTALWAVLYALLGFIAGVSAVGVAVGTQDVAVGLVARAVLVALVVFLVSLLVARRSGLALPWAAGAATIGYLLNPMAWDGRAFIAQMWFPPGPGALLVDLVFWVGLAGVVLYLARRRDAVPR